MGAATLFAALMAVAAIGLLSLKALHRIEERLQELAERLDRGGNDDDR